MSRLAKNEVQVIETKPNGAIPPILETPGRFTAFRGFLDARHQYGMTIFYTHTILRV